MTEAEQATRPSASRADDDLLRIVELDKIVKLSESITSGNHPRIKIPAHLASSSTTAASPRPPLPATRTRRRSTRAAGAAPSAPPAAGLDTAGSASDAHPRGDPGRFGANGHRPDDGTTAAASSLPGLGSKPVARAISPSRVSPSEIPAQRARVEALLRAQLQRAAPPRSGADPAHVDFLVGDVLRKARELERTFTPPPVVVLRAESVDDQTFYSSNFSTPEFALTSRIPAGTGHDAASVQDSSDYEPELNSEPSHGPPEMAAFPPPPLPQQQAAHALPAPGTAPAAPPPAMPAMASQSPAAILASLLGANFDPGSLARPPATQAPAYDPNNGQAQPPPDVAALSSLVGQLAGLAGGLPPPPAGDGRANEQVAAGNPKPSSPFVRTHNLSPVAPQPAHISSLAVAAQLPLVGEARQGASRGSPAQVALLRRGEASQSSADSSPYVEGRPPGPAERKKDRKKGFGKRKADVHPGSPYIKPEPRSPSPLLAPPLHRPHKRPRQEGRPAREAGYGYADEYGPSSQPAPSFAAARPVREARAPVVYERVERGPYAPNRNAPRYDKPRGYDGRYEPVASDYAPPPRPYATRPPSAHPSAHASAVAAAPANVRSARAATHALVEPASGYPMHSTSPGYAMAPPPARAHHLSPPTGRIVVDEFDREYYEPAPHQPAVVDAVSYGPDVEYDRPVAHQHHAAPGPGPRYGGYEEDRVVYQRASPVFVAPRRVLAQPDYATREPAGYPRREFSARPPSYVMNEAAAAPPPPASFLARAATARPPEPARYDGPPPPPPPPPPAAVPLPGRYVERVGSVRPADGVAGYPPSRGLAYEVRAPRGGAAEGGGGGGGVYVEGHHHPHPQHGPPEGLHAYGVPPADAHVVVQRAYSPRPRPPRAYSVELAPYAAGVPPPLPPPPPHAQEYDYIEDTDVYR